MSSSNGSENCGGALMCELGLLFRAREGLAGARAQSTWGPVVVFGWLQLVRRGSLIYIFLSYKYAPLHILGHL